MRKTAKVVHVIELDKEDTDILEGIFSDWSDSARNYSYPDSGSKDTLISEFMALLAQPLSERQKSDAHEAVECA